jgi:dienelactone hydrolase
MLTGLGKKHEFFRYDGTGHAFMGANKEKFREHSARDAWTRALKFIAHHTGGTAPETAAVLSHEELV